jgi:hypothetical protein
MPRARAAPPPDPVEWAQRQQNTIGQRCSLCQQPDIAKFCRGVILYWASGKARPNSISWLKIANQVRASFGTRTHWVSCRNHFRDHEPDVWERLDKYLRGPF